MKRYRRDLLFFLVVLPVIGLSVALASVWPWATLLLIALCFVLERVTR